TTVVGSGHTDLSFSYLLLEDLSGAVASHGVQGSFSTPDVTSAEDDAALPSTFRLQGNYPNPFNPSTTIRFDLPEASDVSVSVFDVMGRTVLAVPASSFAAGSGRSLRVDAGRLPSGSYVYQVTARSASGMRSVTGRMTLLR
ncbi:MAG: T9SS type A sorting domain-containing protein, partial [Rhodothermales bacterium]